MRHRLLQTLSLTRAAIRRNARTRSWPSLAPPVVAGAVHTPPGIALHRQHALYRPSRCARPFARARAEPAPSYQRSPTACYFTTHRCKHSALFCLALRLPRTRRAARLHFIPLAVAAIITPYRIPARCLPLAFTEYLHTSRCNSTRGAGLLPLSLLTSRRSSPRARSRPVTATDSLYSRDPHWTSPSFAAARGCYTFIPARAFLFAIMVRYERGHLGGPLPATIVRTDPLYRQRRIP